MLREQVPRNFTIRQDLLAQMDKQIPTGSRSRWVEKLMMNELKEKIFREELHCSWKVELINPEVDRVKYIAPQMIYIPKISP